MQAFFTLLALSALSLSIDSASLPETSVASFFIGDVTGPQLANAGNTAFVPCPGYQSSVTLLSLTMSPNPPSVKAAVGVSSRGTVTVPIIQGAKMTITTKLGPLTVDTQTFDMCAEAVKAGKKCPVAPGTHDFNLSVKPKLTPLPYLSFDVTAQATNGDGKPLFCFSNKLKFDP